MSRHHPLRFRPIQASAVLLAVLALLTQGCGLAVRSAASDLTRGLTRAIRDSSDLETVRQGGPAYLIMIDALVDGDGENTDLLATAALLNATYADLFVKDRERLLTMTEKARSYGERACCSLGRDLCGLTRVREDDLKRKLGAAEKKDVPALYALGSTWASWIAARSDRMTALAAIPSVRAVMETVLTLDQGYLEGGAHLYLGTLDTLLPPMLGGDPEAAKSHFEQAVRLSGGRNLMAKVMYARQYARMVYDKDLHDRLLGQVLEADPGQPGYTLINTLAKIKARELLDGSDDYF